MPSKQYGRLRDSADSQEALLEKSDEHPPVRRWTRATVIIATQTIAIAILLATVALQAVPLSGSDIRRRGFSTDFGNLGDLIPFKQQAFINPLRPTADFSALKMEWKEGEPHYTGPPGPEMDEAWDKMLAMTTFNISGDAAKPAVGKTHQYDDGKYAMGFEVFHALHCINNIRMMMYPENYILNEPKEETELHKAHCLDYLRQYVQCNADLTPFWGDWVPKYRLVLRPYTPHTCRDWSRLTEWIDPRAYAC
ncbi:Putative mycotoxin biosynthesis protein UstYa [Septoria linicola]|uniref:Mycotoxin biosynthesis protein UstYa n=1 Tax=Septoria linicola TaxID=215465 RepID=A0A9Q9B2I8_9PEZI|nr:putative mycotoxin biosynthesis protein UstYa [Septoria linicola]USW59465.1 Putative mycotoxin biosynthesis protein UstYa [Septoria linicola]